VKCIVTEDSTATGLPQVTGVEMEDGTFISCSTVVSTAGYHNTFNRLVSQEVTDKLSIPRSLKLPGERELAHGNGWIMANFGIRVTAEELELTNTNYWYHPVREADDFNLFAALERFYGCKTQPPVDPATGAMPEPSVMITWPSMKDPEWKAKHPDMQMCQILCVGEWEWFEKYAEQDQKMREDDAEYQAQKEALKDMFEKMLHRFYPKTEGHVELSDVSTPLSIEHYLWTHKGSATGMDHSPSRFTNKELMAELDMQSKLPGLWLSGQDTLICGLPLVQIAGLITALRMSSTKENLGYLFNSLRIIGKILFQA